MKKLNWKLLLGVLLCGGLVLAGRALPTFSASAVPLLIDSGVGYDPLTATEAARALALAVQASEQGRFNQNAQQATPQALEILAVERYDAPKGSNVSGTVRQGTVYLYDYATDTLLHNIVDINSGAMRVEEYQGVQLPLTVREEARAVQLLRDDAELWSALAHQYRRITGEPLTDIAQLQVKVSLFLGESMPDQVNTEAQQCGQHRCAQVLLFTTNRTLLEALPIVDLSQGRVIQVLSDSWRAPAGDESSGGN